MALARPVPTKPTAPLLGRPIYQADKKSGGEKKPDTVMFSKITTTRKDVALIDCTHYLVVLKFLVLELFYISVVLISMDLDSRFSSRQCITLFGRH